MTSTTPAYAAVPAPQLGPQRRPGFTAVLLSEWTKLRSVRSTVWTLVVTAVLTIGIGLIACAVEANHWHLGDLSTQYSLAGMYLGQLAIAVLGVMVVTTEYSTGMIRTSLTAVPHRGALYAAKALLLAAVVLVAGEVVAFVSFLGGNALLAAKDHGTTLSEPGVLRTVVGAGLYLAVLGLFGAGIGAMLRHTAGAISAVIGVVLVLPTIVALIFHSISWGHDVVAYLPSVAGDQVWMQVPTQDGALAPWTGFAVFCAYTAVVLFGGYAVLRTRDA